MSQEPQSFKSRLKESIKHNPIYTKAIRPLRVKLNTLIESRLTDEQYFVRRHKKIFGYTPDFRNPKTFNEKIIHRILFDRSPVYTALADKLKARIYIAAKLYPLYENAIRGGAECKENAQECKHSLDSSAQSTLSTQELSTIQALAKINLLDPSSPLFAPIDTLGSTLLATNICPYLPKLYGIYKSFDDIDFASLPAAFAIKTNHDGGGVVLVPDKQEFLRDQARFEAARRKIQQHLATNFYTLFREWHYKDIEPRVFIEELLGADSRESSTKTFENDDFHNKIAQDLESYKAPTDYKCHLFNGTLSHIEVIRGRFVHQEEIALDEQWQKLPFDYEKRATTLPPPPKDLPTMKQIASLLSQPFAYVRVDLYEIDSAIFFGEMTFTPACGTDKFSPQEWDHILGDRWKMRA